MKTLLMLFGIVLALVALGSASLRQEKEAAVESRKPGCGYTIIEFGKGIDCHGDTVVLAKVPGGQQLADINYTYHLK